VIDDAVLGKVIQLAFVLQSVVENVSREACVMTVDDGTTVLVLMFSTWTVRACPPRSTRASTACTTERNEMRSLALWIAGNLLVTPC
jgi:hypothetical protein